MHWVKAHEDIRALSKSSHLSLIYFPYISILVLVGKLDSNE